MPEYDYTPAKPVPDPNTEVESEIEAIKAYTCETLGQDPVLPDSF